MSKTIDIQFTKDIAEDFGHDITDEQAIAAHEEIIGRCADQDYYYGMKEYFAN